jgi:di/tricarboxylate transporter
VPSFNTATPLRHNPLRRLLQALIRDRFLLILLAVLLLLSLFKPGRIASYPRLVDWPTLATLTGLLMLTKGLEDSGALHRLGRWLTGFMTSERSAALGLVTAAALLAMLLTNDVALFVVVPLTLSLCRSTGMAATRLIIFEALAVNAGSALTPIGNPQNLFLWQRSALPFGDFVVHMLPLVAGLMLALLLLTACVFRARPITLSDAGPLDRRPLDRPLLIASLALYLPLLAAAEWQLAGWAVVAILLLFALLRPGVLSRVDWGLLLIFMLMFIDLRLIANLAAVRHALLGLGLAQPTPLYAAGIAVSQLISNVPATIALAEYTADWHVLAYAVNIGGFGLAVGSLANLIALRMTGDRSAWLTFHLYSLPFLGLAAAFGYLLLFVAGRP